MNYPDDCDGWICPDCQPYGCAFAQGKEDEEGNLIKDMRQINKRGTKMKFSLDQWVETNINGTTKQGQIIDYLIDDDDEEYCIQFNDKEIQWVAGVALRPIDANWATGESATELAPIPHPAEEFLSEG